MSEQPTQSRFFPHFVVCPSCEYELGTDYLDTCPECGLPLDNYFERGRVIDIEQHHLDALPDDHNPRPDRYIDGLLKHSTLDLCVTPVIASFGVFFIILVISNFNIPYTSWSIAAFCIITGMPAAILAIGIYAEIKAIIRRRQLKKGLLTGKVEQHEFIISRALIFEFAGRNWLLLYSDWPATNAKLIIPPNELERLQINPVVSIGNKVRLDRIPNSSAIVGFSTHGDPVTTRTTNRVKPRLLARLIRVIRAYEHEHNLFPKRKTGSFFTSDA